MPFFSGVLCVLHMCWPVSSCVGLCRRVSTCVDVSRRVFTCVDGARSMVLHLVCYTVLVHVDVLACVGMCKHVSAHAPWCCTLYVALLGAC